MNKRQARSGLIAALTAFMLPGSPAVADDCRVDSAQTAMTAATFLPAVRDCRNWESLNRIYDDAQKALDMPQLLQLGQSLTGISDLRTDNSRLAALRFRQLGWQSLDAGDNRTAADFAELALRLEPSNDQEALSIIAFVTLRNGQAAYDAGDYATALQLAEAAARTPDAAAPAAILKGWSLHQTGDYRAAADTFWSVLDSPESAAAEQGLALTLAKGGDQLLVWRQGKVLPAGVSEKLIEADAERAFGRDHFLIAVTQAPRAWPDLADVDRGWVQSGVLGRTTDGQDGLDQYRAYTPFLAYGNSRDRHKFSILIEFPQIDIGHPAPGALLGFRPLSGPGNDRVSPLDETDGAQVRLSYTREGMWQPFFEVGTTQGDAAVSTRAVGQLGLIRHLARGGLWSVSFFSEPRRDSLLAESGLVDPVTGDAYGQVNETGFLGQALVPIAPQWSVVGEVRAAEIDGKNVADNERIAAGLGVSRNFPLEGFEYFSLGLFGKVEQYDRNSDFYTFGNGGYFSPEDFKSLSLILSFQTDELQRFVIRGSASIGYEDVDEGNGTPFPLGLADATRRLSNAGFTAPLLSVDQGAFNRRSRTGAAGSAGVEGVYLLNSKWAVIGYAGFSKAENFTEYVGGLSLRYFFGQRQAVVSGDIFPPRLGFSQR